MRTDTLYKDDKNIVVAFYVRDKLFYTRTYTLDSEGFAVKTVTVYTDGTVSER